MKSVLVGVAVLGVAAAGAVWLLREAPAPASPTAAGARAGSASGALPLAGPALAAVASTASAASANEGLAAAGEPAPPPAATATPTQALRAIVRCHAADSCHFTRGEGLDEHFEVAARLVQQLERLGAEGSPAEQAAWARELLAFPEGHVQAAALALAAKLPPSAETVAAAVSALGKSYDAVLLRQAYPVLKQWQQVGLNSGYDDMFVNLVHTGGWQAAQSVAENVGPFLNAGNVGRFEQVARQLQPGARQQALLKSLRDYQLQLQGG